MDAEVNYMLRSKFDLLRNKELQKWINICGFKYKKKKYLRYIRTGKNKLDFILNEIKNDHLKTKYGEVKKGVE